MPATADELVDMLLRCVGLLGDEGDKVAVVVGLVLGLTLLLRLVRTEFLNWGVGGDYLSRNVNVNVK